MIERHLPLIATRKATAVRVDAYRAVPLTIQLSIPDDIGSLAGATILRAEIRASRTDATTTALAGTSIAAPSGQSFDLTFTSAQMNQSLAGEESVEFWLVVYATYPPGVVEGSTELELDVFASIDLVLHEHAASLTAPSPPNAAIALTKTQADLLYMPIGGGGAGTGSVTTVSVVSANGVSGTVANPTSTPAITLALGAITPTSVTATGQVRGGTGVFDTSATITGSANFGNNTTFVYGTNAAANHRSALGLGTAAQSAASDFAASTRTVNGQALSSDVTITTISGNAGGFTGSLVGDVTGTQSATAIAATTVTGKILTGFISGSGTITSADSILTAFNKINGNDLLKAPLANPTFTGTVNGTFSGSLTGNVTGNVSGTSANFTGLLSGDVTGTQLATAISASTVTGKALTGYVSGSGTVTSSDSILTAINKLNGNTALKADTSSLGTLATLSPTGTPISTTYLRGDNTWATVSAGGFTGTANRIIIGGATTMADSNLETTIATTGTNATVNCVTLKVPDTIGTAATSLVLTPRGTGAVIAGSLPDGTSTGGNARGVNAVDFQRTRDTASAVASGNGSFIAGGYRNTASGSYAFSCGEWNSVGGFGSSGIGYRNTITGGNTDYAFTGIGSTNNISGAYGEALTAIGRNNTVSASFKTGATSIGHYCTSNETGSLATGSYSKADRFAQFSHAAGQFAAAGDAQRSNFVLRCVTSLSSAAVEMALDGGTTYLTIPSGKTMAFTAHIAGTKVGGTDGAYFIRKGIIRNNAGTITLIGTIVEETVYAGTGGTTTCVVDAFETAADYLRIRVATPWTSAETWRWVANVEAIEIGHT